MTTIGIDLGTTYSAVSYIAEDGQPKIIPNEDGVNLTPSVVAFVDGEIYVGNDAKDYQRNGSENVASFFKRSMGDPYFELEFEQKLYNTIDLSALLLQKLKQGAEAFLGQAVDKAVITVPAYFNNAQREATLEAGKRIGLEVLSILNEPTAATIAYGIRPGLENKHILVYDLGGGTFDVTISKVTQNDIKVLATEGDHNLGGKDFDDTLANYIALLFEDDYGLDLFEDDGALNALLVEVEQAKIRLTQQLRTNITVIQAGKRATYEITQQRFEELCERLLERTWSLVELALTSAKLTVNQLDEIILVGGSTRMKMISKFIAARAQISPKSQLNVDEVVALGAGIQAHLLTTEKKTTPQFSLGPVKKIEDVMSHSLGMVVVNSDFTQYKNSIMIEKNKRIPTKKSKAYQLHTAKNRENKLDIYLTQGESEDLANCEIIGKYCVSNIPYTTQQPTQLTVMFGYDANGVVEISAQENSQQKTLLIDVERSIGDTNWLYAPPEKTQQQPINIYLVIDTSGSMSGQPIREAIKAGKEFVNTLDGGQFNIGLIAFANQVKTIAEPTQNFPALAQAIDQLENYVSQSIIGGGTGGMPLTYLTKQLAQSSDKTIILVLTDGQWFNEAPEIEASKKLLKKDVDVLAVGFGDANEAFLGKIASSDEDAFLTNLSSLVESFTTIAQEVAVKYRLK